MNGEDDAEDAGDDELQLLRPLLLCPDVPLLLCPDVPLLGQQLRLP